MEDELASRRRGIDLFCKADELVATFQHGPSCTMVD